MTKNKSSSGLYLVLATAFISGLSIFLNKFGVSGINPFVFTGLKNFLVAALLLVLIINAGEFKKLKKLKLGQWFRLFLIGLLGGSLPFLLFFKGLALTSAGQASFIHKNIFLVAALLASVFLKERLEKKFLLAIPLLLGGNFLFFNFPGSNQGNLFILLAVFFWAVENIVSKRTLKSLSPQIVAFGRMFFGSLLIAVFLIITNQLSLITQLTLQQGNWIILTSLLLFGYVLSWYTGLASVKVSSATAILTLGAPITSLLTALVVRGNVFPQDWWGIGLIFTGILLIIKTQKTKRVLSKPADVRS